jgi:hypothetical protein
METYGDEGISPPFLSSALAVGELSASHPGRFTPRERAPGTHWLRGWVVPRAGLDAVEYRKISCLCRESNPGCPACSPSLYRLSYPGSAWRRFLMKLLFHLTGYVNAQNKRVGGGGCWKSSCNSWEVPPSTEGEDVVCSVTYPHNWPFLPHDRQHWCPPWHF